HQQERDAMQLALDALEAERLHLETGAEIAPPVPHVRDDAPRATRAGAPFWKLVDFHAAVPAEARAGIEAALESAGLLDAWVLPGGQLLDPYTWDTLLTADPTAPARALDAMLRPAVDWQDTAQQPVGAAEVAAILARIGLGEHPEQAHWVSEDGRWRLGPARGAWAKDEARYIGHAAREAARQARLRQIASESQVCRDAIAAAGAALGHLDQREARIRDEWQGRPDDGPLRTAYAEEASALRALENQTERTEMARKALDARSHEAGQQRQRRDELAADLSLPSAEDPLDAVARAVEAYAGGTRELCRGLREQRREQDRLEGLLRELEQAQGAARKAAEDATSAEASARNAETQRDTLRETIGADVAELERRLGEVEQRQTRLKAEFKAIGQERTQLAGEIGGLEHDIANGEQQLVEIGERRSAAIGRLRELADAGLVPMATDDRVTIEADLSWASEPAVLLSRRMEQALAEVDESDAAWQRTQKGLHQHFAVLQGALGRHGHDAHIEQQDDLLLVRIIFQGRHHGPDALAGQLAREIERRRELLTARERELVENYLLDEVASHLQVRLMETERQVRQINEELAERPTSTGMRLRLQWQPLAEGQEAAGLTAPAGLEVTRNRLLRQSMDAWSVDDRRAVGEFIQGRIREARETDSAGALADVLERALDYRHWHRFTVERWQNGRWRPAYGPASGGERALVITLPLFAAAASHYESAQAVAPRMIMLDEVFAGVDDDARAKSMGLLAQFDLDAMMTSEREWGCYPQVPGLAIAQLIRREGIDAVYVSRWRWDGAHRIRESDPQTPMEPSGAETATKGPGTEELF
ncbi:MAG: TIGR02680 family protein, partial [Thioalkalivibrio sp.]|nr:TIGR02680 family protein [Thioalkalivibrio sp.]